MSIERLPLFLLDTVLMPHMVLPLHVFEVRYQEMMRDVLAAERRFGILLRRRASGMDREPAPHEVGTVAEVTAVAPVEGGRMNISTTGAGRFRVTRFHHDRSYLTGDVEILSDAYHPSNALRSLQTEVERLGVAYVSTVLALSQEQVEQVRLPPDPVTLSYKLAGLLVAIKPAEAQHLLESPTVEHRLYAEVLLLRRELAILRRMGEMNNPAGRTSPN